MTPVVRFLILFLALETIALAAPADDLASAVALYQADKLVEAQQALQKIVAVTPDQVEANSYLGWIAVRRNEPEKAVEYFEKAAAGAPQDASIQQALGGAYATCAQQAGIFSKLSLAAKCRRAFERAVELDPQNTGYRSSLMAYYQQAPAIAGGSMEKAYAEAAEIRRINRRDGCQAFVSLYIGEKKYDQAFAEFDEALQAAPDDYATLYGLGKLAIASHQRLDEGLSAFKRCLELTPKPNQAAHDAAWSRIGQVYELKGDFASARTAFETALKLNPNSASALEGLKRIGASVAKS